jgi:hypothetical protein
VRKLTILAALIPVSLLVLPGRPLGDRAPTGRVSSGWSQLPAPPQSFGALAWTGKYLVSWGGSYAAGGASADGALYDVTARRWRSIPRAPLGAREWPAVTWTGSRVLVWGGWREGREGRRFADGAALDPQTLAWTRLPRAPLSPRSPAASVWTGKELDVWGDVSRSSHRRDGAAYNPRRQSWRRLRAAPLALNQVSSVWMQGEWIVYGAWLDGNNESRTKYARGMAYEPATNRWRILHRFRLSPQAASIAVAGTHVLAWDYVLGAGLYEPRNDRWTRLPRLPLSAAECYPESATVGAIVFAWYCGRGALFDVSSRRWSRLSGPRRGLTHGKVIAAGSRAFFLGHPDRGGPPELWAYTP